MSTGLFFRKFRGIDIQHICFTRTGAVEALKPGNKVFAAMNRNGVMRKMRLFGETD